MAVGVFDSGLGGLTVLDAVSKALPDVQIVTEIDKGHIRQGLVDRAGRGQQGPAGCALCLFR